jgi:hypothetical protein
MPGGGAFAAPLSPQCKYEWYGYGGPPPFGTALFDANGDPVLNGQWHLWNSGGPVGGVSLTSPVFGAANAMVQPNGPAMPSISAPTTQGYVINNGNGRILLKFNCGFANGGFQYCTVTF